MLKSIDPSTALKLEGVIDFVSSTDVPGLNDVSAFTCAPLPNSTKIKPYQPVFVPIGQEVVFVGQPLGLICATSREIAERAALLVTATYEDSDEKPIVTIEDGIAKKSFYSTDYNDYEHVAGDPDEALKKAKNVVTGTVKGGGMRHFYMEKQSTLAVRVDFCLTLTFNSRITNNTQY